MGLIHLGTELQEWYQIGTDVPRNTLYGSSIERHYHIPSRETMLKPSVDHQSEFLIAGNTAPHESQSVGKSEVEEAFSARKLKRSLILEIH
jgi:hypothetical protein